MGDKNGPGRPAETDPKVRPPSITIRESVVTDMHDWADRLSISQSAAYQEALEDWIRKQRRLQKLISL